MLAFQARDLPPPEEAGNVELAFFGSSAFRVTAPSGLTLMLDPWRNHPARQWDWYFHDFPLTAVDIGVSTHAHFDHDALHRLDASTLLDRPIGEFRFGDVRVTGIADKHAIDFSQAPYDAGKLMLDLHGIDVRPPNNPRSWDHCLVLVETGGLRILHWGDNRPDPPESVWQALGRIDVLLMPIDESRHVMGWDAAERVIDRLQPKVVIPHHYYIWNVVQRQSTLQPARSWVATQADVWEPDGPAVTLSPDTLGDTTRVIHFGDHVAFDVEAWFGGGGED
ncbi:MAG: MBL fold metallo-hydrolase [Alphaproteobacteria bacterium]|nr:MBL fold metallo-hydrolase [Alphaproteobacteria bacterium]MCB9930517.1 MBL fold metallo-hydrolase [Alphaproteobacteria bacterium]